MSEFRKPSILDTITPLQSQAFGIENDGLNAPMVSRRLFMSTAAEIRRQDFQNKLQALDEISEQQNCIIDIGLEMQGIEHEMTQGVDYTIVGAENASPLQV